MLDLRFAYLRSRMTRVVKYINGLSLELKQENISETSLKIPNINKKRKYFKTKININKIEAEFGPNETSFYKIIDEKF